MFIKHQTVPKTLFFYFLTLNTSKNWRARARVIPKLDSCSAQKNLQELCQAYKVITDEIVCKK